ncbi:uncharacterized protein GBIM_16165, partial [Gryllus bimaculatus]
VRDSPNLSDVYAIKLYSPSVPLDSVRKSLVAGVVGCRRCEDVPAMPSNAKEDFVVEHDGEKYNIGKFLHFHPGGRNTLAAFEGRDITQKLRQYEHSDSALYLMKESDESSTRVTDKVYSQNWAYRVGWELEYSEFGLSSDVLDGGKQPD